MTEDLQKIVILNPKGGSGKTTIATNLAAHFAQRKMKTAILDYDSQRSSTRWVEKRQAKLESIEIIKGYQHSGVVTKSWLLRGTPGTQRLIVDTSAAIDRSVLCDLTRDAASIIVPVLPSEIDIHAASRCIGDLLLTAKIRLEENRIGVVANRVRKNTKVYQALMRFLLSLGIPFLATFRDAQNYVYAAGAGVGISEMPAHKVRIDVESWKPLLEWLDRPDAMNMDHLPGRVTARSAIPGAR